MSAKIKTKKKPIEQYSHKQSKRLNNPPVGLVTPETDKDTGKKTYAYDPHLDPSLQWAGKAERTSFEIPTVSLHVHERIDPRTILEAVRKKNGKNYEQLSLFGSREENPPLREAIEFYKHPHGWTNRLIAGDSLLVMNSLLEKEGLAGQVQMIYIDPPYGIRYGSNFQPFVNKRDIKDGKDDDLTQEPEMVKAFRDTWDLGIHSYLSYLRDRLRLAKELLHERGSIFVQIGEENLHLVRSLLEEIFGSKNFVCLICFRKRSMPLTTKTLPTMSDYLIWFGKSSEKVKYRKLYVPKNVQDDDEFTFVELASGKFRRMTNEELSGQDSLPEKSKIFKRLDLCASGYGSSTDFEIEFEGKTYRPTRAVSWKTSRQGIKNLISANRIFALGDGLYYKIYFKDFPMTSLTNLWDDTRGEVSKTYAVQTSASIVQRCILMTTDPGELVFDPTCGSGTLSYVAEQWGRRWISCDTSRVAITLAKQRLMTATFQYYHLAHPDEGIASGLKYSPMSHITLGSIANNDPPEQETIYDQPLLDNDKVRVSGPFTVEAVPSPVVKALSDIKENESVDESLSRSGETLRQAEWREELFKTGIRGRSGQKIKFSRVEPMSATQWLHADAETREEKPERVAISFGPQDAPLEQRQVALALEEAHSLVPKPKIIVFAAFQFDPEASKDIDETKWPGITVLKAQMNTDLLTEDLKKKRSSNESFFLIGQPEIKLSRIKNGDLKGKYQVEVLGFDYFNTKSGLIESGGTEKIALWMLDTDYDGRSLFPRQIFFLMDPLKDGLEKLAKNLRAEIDEERIQAYFGSSSLPFEIGEHKRAAVKIVDDRGIESLKIIPLS